MKRILLILVLFFIGFKFYGQEQKFSVSDTITLLHHLQIKDKSSQKAYSILDNKTPLKTINPNILSRGYKYIITNRNSTNNTVTLQPLNFKIYKTNRINRRKKRRDILERNTIDKSILSILYNNKTFIVDEDNFDKSATKKHYEYSDKLSIGLLSLPFKARPQDDFSFDTEFNLSTTLNWNITSFYNAKFNAQFGAGIGSVNLNNNNATVGENGEQDVSVLNFFTGLMLEYKKVQAGIYLGVDQINNQKTYNWEHNGNIWFGFGIGLNVFKIKLGDNKTEQ